MLLCAATEKPLDGPSLIDWRNGCAKGFNMIPSSTSATKVSVVADYSICIMVTESMLKDRMRFGYSACPLK
jgi:hypothetical protein